MLTSISLIKIKNSLFRHVLVTSYGSQ